jgi:signal transduction histidine kinase
MSDPLLLVGKDASVKILNRSALQYYRVESQDVTGRPCYQAFMGRSDPCEECRIPSFLSNGKQVTFERKGFMDPDLIEQVSIYPLHEKHREMGGAILRISDITEKKNVAKQLMRAHRLSSLGQLSGGIAHEIRNPLSGINLFVDILCDAEKFKRADQELEIFEEIKQSIKKINGIIKRVLDFAKHSDATSGEIEINSLIDEVLKLWHKKMRDTKIRQELSLQKDLSPIRGDAIEIQQVVNNLIQNAVEAMPAGGVLDIATRNGISSFHQDRPVVLIRIGDSGPGIPTEQCEKIFDPFFTTKSTGTGLGLSISHQIIERHGGIISFENRSKQATTFSIELPAAAGS